MMAVEELNNYLL